MLHLCQSDPVWNKQLLWFSPTTVGDSGCALTCAAELQREFKIREDATPMTAQADCVARWIARGRKPLELPAIVLPPQNPAKPGVNIVWATVFDSLGMIISGRIDETAGLKAMRDTIIATLSTGGRALLHVDHDENRKGGDHDGDHYVTARRIENDRLIYGDPADGAEWSLPLGLLVGPASWGARTFAVRGVRAVRKK